MKMMMRLVSAVFGRSSSVAPGAKAPGAQNPPVDSAGTKSNMKDWHDIVTRPIFVTNQFRQDVARIFGRMSRSDKELSALAMVIEGSPIYYQCVNYPDDVMSRNFCTVDVNVNDDPRVVSLFREKLTQTEGRCRVAPVHIHPMNYPQLSATDISTYETFRKSATEPTPLGHGNPYPVILINLKESYTTELLGFWVMEGKMFATRVQTIEDDSPIVKNAWRTAKPVAYFSEEAALARRIDKAAGPDWNVRLGVSQKTGGKALLVNGKMGRTVIPLQEGRFIDIEVEDIESHLDWNALFTNFIEKERKQKEMEERMRPKIMVSTALKDEMSNLPRGTLVLGVWSPSELKATITKFVKPDSEEGLISRCVLAVVGVEGDINTPFRVSPNGIVTTSEGKPVEVRTYNEGDFYKRTPFNAELMAVLAKERVLVIGCGSVGAAMSLELAKNGIGQLILADMDNLEIHNSMRHVLGAGYVGLPKTVALKGVIEEHVPMCNCVSIPEDILAGNRELLRKTIEAYRPTRILAVTDVYHIQNLCQLAAIHYAIPYMAVSCGTNAVEGEVFLWEPGQALGWKEGRPKRGCYFCAHGLSVGGHRSSTFDYSSDSPGSYGGEPALGAFISRINATATTIMLSWMLKNHDSKLSQLMAENYERLGLQYIRIGGPYLQPEEGFITAKAPWGVEWMRTKKIDECPICGDDVDTEKILFPEDSSPIPMSWEQMGTSEISGCDISTTNEKEVVE